MGLIVTDAMDMGGVTSNVSAGRSSGARGGSWRGRRAAAPGSRCGHSGLEDAR